MRTPRSFELLSAAQMDAVDRLAMQAGAGDRLLRAAGWAVAQAALRFGPCRTLVLCGPGNNGGDGYVAARLLAQRGWPVELAASAPPAAGTGAARAAARWRGPMVPFSAESARRAGLVIDAVFGAGLSRPLDPEVAAVLAASGRVLAVDVPSGLDGSTGQARGPVRAAALTVTFCRRKPGHLLQPGRALCGELVLADIGIPDALVTEVAPDTFQNQPGLWRLPGLDMQAHKYARGHVTVLGGAAMTGAARLAAGGARHAGTGMVSIAATGAADVYRSGAPGVIVTEAPLDALLADARRQVWVCGPGLGADTARATLPRLIAAGRQIVADADSFAAFAGAPDALRGCAVITPHAGEFARMFGPPETDRLHAARDAARRIDAVVVLKGSDTIIAAPDGRAAINANAPPWLATAGSGDVLSGVVAAMLAAGLPAWEAAGAAVWLHGQAANRAGAGMLAEDLLPALARVVGAQLVGEGAVG